MSDIVSFGGRPLVRFFEVPHNDTFARWAAEAMKLLPGAGFSEWVDLPVFFLDPEMMLYVGSGDAIGVLDRVGDNLVPAYGGQPPLPQAVYDEFDKHLAVLAAGLNTQAIADDEDPEYALKSTLLHEVAHGIYEAAPSHARAHWGHVYDRLVNRYGDNLFAGYLFAYGAEEAFCELFQKHLRDDWHGEPHDVIDTFERALHHFQDRDPD